MAKKRKEDEAENPETLEQEQVSEENGEELTREQELEMQLAEKCDQFLRQAAEYDNFRKRSQREKEELYTMARSSIISITMRLCPTKEIHLTVTGIQASIGRPIWYIK